MASRVDGEGVGQSQDGDPPGASINMSLPPCDNYLLRRPFHSCLDVCYVPSSLHISFIHPFSHLLSIYRMPTVCWTIDTLHYGRQTSPPPGVYSLVAVGL